MKTISEAYFEAFREYTATRDWLSEVYGTGQGSRPMEVALTRSVVASMGGTAELRSAADIPNFPFPGALDAAFASYGELRGERARIDGYFEEGNCFWEAKVSKIDKPTRPGARALYDIGQWAQDLAKLTEIGRFLPQVGLICSVAVIAKERLPGVSESKDWLRLVRRKLCDQLYGDLTRDEPELLERQAYRKRQLRLLIDLIALDVGHFYVIPSERWAVVSFEASSLV